MTLQATSTVPIEKPAVRRCYAFGYKNAKDIVAIRGGGIGWLAAGGTAGGIPNSLYIISSAFLLSFSGM